MVSSTKLTISATVSVVQPKPIQCKIGTKTEELAPTQTTTQKETRKMATQTDEDTETKSTNLNCWKETLAE